MEFNLVCLESDLYKYQCLRKLLTTFYCPSSICVVWPSSSLRDCTTSSQVSSWIVLFYNYASPYSPVWYSSLLFLLQLLSRLSILIYLLLCSPIFHFTSRCLTCLFSTTLFRMTHAFFVKLPCELTRKSGRSRSKVSRTYLLPNSSFKISKVTWLHISSKRL